MLPELYEEPDIDLELFEAAAEADAAAIDELALRSLMIEAAKAEREIEKVKRTRDTVANAYNDRIASIEARQQRVRSMLQAWLERQPDGQQKIRFEDVGTAYLAKGDPKVEVVDHDALKSALGAMFTKPSFDETAAKNYALEEATAGRPLADGVNIIPGGPQLRIRKA